MKITGEEGKVGGGVWSLLKEWTIHSLSRVLLPIFLFLLLS